MEIKQATRQGVKALVGLYGKSGGGKTLTGLFLARGLAGAKGRVTLIDTESGRGSIFADIVPGGYQVIEVDAPFSPDAYTQAIRLAPQWVEAVPFVPLAPYFPLLLVPFDEATSPSSSGSPASGTSRLSCSHRFRR